MQIKKQKLVYYTSKKCLENNNEQQENSKNDVKDFPKGFDEKKIVCRYYIDGRTVVVYRYGFRLHP